LGLLRLVWQGKKERKKKQRLWSGNGDDPRILEKDVGIMRPTVTRNPPGGGTFQKKVEEAALRKKKKKKGSGLQRKAERG